MNVSKPPLSIAIADNGLKISCAVVAGFIVNSNIEIFSHFEFRLKLVIEWMMFGWILCHRWGKGEMAVGKMTDSTIS